MARAVYRTELKQQRLQIKAMIEQARQEVDLLEKAEQALERAKQFDAVANTLEEQIRDAENSNS